MSYFYVLLQHKLMIPENRFSVNAFQEELI